MGAASVLLAARIGTAAEVFPVVHNQPVLVRVVDGRDGRPQPRLRVLLTGGYDLRDLRLGQWHEEATTDRDGVVHLSNNLRNLPLLRVEVVNSHVCEPDANLTEINVEEIQQSGLSGANRCGAVMAADVPGVFTLFVKGKKGPAADGGFAIGAGPASLSSAEPVAVNVSLTPTLPAAPHQPNILNIPKSPVSSPGNNDLATALVKQAPLATAVTPGEPDAPISMLLSYAFDNLAVDVGPSPAAPRAAAMRLSVPTLPLVRPHGIASTASGAEQARQVAAPQRHKPGAGRAASPIALAVKQASGSAQGHADGSIARSAHTHVRRAIPQIIADQDNAKATPHLYLADGAGGSRSGSPRDRAAAAKPVPIPGLGSPATGAASSPSASAGEMPVFRLVQHRPSASLPLASSLDDSSPDGEPSALCLPDGP
jgi:hypothetical protein